MSCLYLETLSLQSHLFDEGRQSSNFIRFRLHFVGFENQAQLDNISRDQYNRRMSVYCGLIADGFIRSSQHLAVGGNGFRGQRLNPQEPR